MTISKKLFFIFTAVVSISSIESHPRKVKLNTKGQVAIMLALVVPGPCLMVNGVKNLSFAKTLQNELKNPQILAPSLEEMAHSLKRRGRIGLFFGTILSLPIPVAVVNAYKMDQDVLTQEKEKLADQNAAILDEKP